MDEKEKKTNSSLVATVLVTLLVAGGGGFFAGMKYQQSKVPGFIGRNEDISGFQPGNFNGQRPGGNGSGFTPVNGTVINQDGESITVELADGSSKIVLIADNTSINITEEGSSDDLSEGIEVVVFGQTNSDGSVTAQNIQIGDAGVFRNQPPVEN